MHFLTFRPLNQMPFFFILVGWMRLAKLLEETMVAGWFVQISITRRLIIIALADHKKGANDECVLTCQRTQKVIAI